jgi:cysteine desulfurase
LVTNDFDPIYLDYMATTPVDETVAEEMMRCLTVQGNFGNPSSATHLYGWRALDTVTKARELLADSIGAMPREVIFTSGATEANNLAIQGAARFYAKKGRHIITTTIEHKAILDVFYALEKEGFNITLVSPNSDGIISVDAIADAITPQTTLVSTMWVNNEIGAIQPIADIAALTRQHGILFHVDAAQAMGKVAVDLSELPVDLMSFSAHKVYGPKGSGALFVRDKPRARLTPLFWGGEQEQGLRAGTLATHQIVGMAAAFHRAKLHAAEDLKHIQSLNAILLPGLLALEGVTLNGSLDLRVPHNINVCFQGLNAEALLMSLPQIAVSAGSACNSAQEEPSHVLKAIGLSDLQARASLRFSLGRYTTEKEIKRVLELVRLEVQRERDLAGK